MGIQYYRVNPSSHALGVGFLPDSMGESITKPARFACLPPAALPLSPAVLPCRCRLRCLPLETLPPAPLVLALPAVLWPAACRYPAACPAVMLSRLPAALLPPACR